MVGAVAGAVSLAGCTGGDDGGENGNDSNVTDDTGGTGSQSGDDSSGQQGTEIATGAESMPVLGDPTADVTVEVYQDLNCPACRLYNQQGFPAVQTEFLAGDRIRYEYRSFVVTGTAGEQAASAAREVFERHGNEPFWAFKSELYRNQDRMPADVPAVFGEIATQLELDADAIATAGQQRSHQQTVDADYSRGQDFGVPGTPSFVVDGELLDTQANTVDGLVSDLTQRVESALDSR